MTAYEWWCPRCRVTHPAGRKVCLHCGGRVQPERNAPTAFDPRAALEGRLRRPSSIDAAEDALEEDAPESRTSRGARLGLTLVWIALAVAASLLRLCQEPG